MKAYNDNVCMGIEQEQRYTSQNGDCWIEPSVSKHYEHSGFVLLLRNLLVRISGVSKIVRALVICLRIVGVIKGGRNPPFRSIFS